MKNSLTRLATIVAVAVVVVGGAVAVHKAAPWNLEVIVYPVLLLAYAVIASRPEKVTVSRHLHRTAGTLILKGFTGAATFLGGVGLTAVAAAVAWTFWAPGVTHVKDTAAGKATTVVTDGAKTGASNAIEGAFTKVTGDAKGAFSDFQARRTHRHEQETTGGRPR